MEHRLKTAAYLLSAFATALLLVWFMPAGEANTVQAAGYQELMLDSTDLSMMVQASDGYYYWAEIDVNSASYWEIRFKMKGQTAVSVETLNAKGTIDLYKDNGGNYVFNGSGYWDAGHDVYTFIDFLSTLNAIFLGNDGAINVRVDYNGTLYAYSTSILRTNLYIKSGGNRSLKIYNIIAPSESSWSGNKAAGFGSIFQLDNGTYSLRTRQIVFDGGDHYTVAYSMCSNCVYVADGCSYYSYGDEFLHGYTSAVISNHHSNEMTTSYGENYVRIENGYFHDCLVGAVANNRLEIKNTVFQNCNCAVAVSGTGGAESGSAIGGQNGLWNIYGSSLTMENCKITGSAAEAYRGVEPYAVNIAGNYLTGGSATSISIINTSIDVAGRDINIDNLSGKRNILIEGCTLKNSYHTAGIGIYQNNRKGGKTTLLSNTVRQNSAGIYNVAGNIDILSGETAENDWGIINGGTCTLYGGNIHANKNGGIYQNGILNMEQDAAVDSNNRIYLETGHIVDITGELLESECGKIDIADRERKVGRLLVKVDYTSDSAVRTDQAERFSLWSKAVMYNADGSSFSGVENSGRLRSAARLDSSASSYAEAIGPQYGFLNAEYKLTFDGDMEGSGIVTIVPDPLVFFWCEPTIFDFSVRASTNMPFQNTGWSKKQGSEKPDYTKATILTETENIILYAVWELDGVKFVYYGNRNTGYDEAKAKQISEDGIHMDEAGQQYFIASSMTVAPENPYVREEDMRYSFVGWSTDKSAVYTSSGILSPKEAVSGPGTAISVESLKEMILDGRISYDYSGQVVFNYYAVWDKYPKLTTSDIYLYREAAASLTEADIYAHMQAEDREDGVLKTENFSLQEFDPSVFISENDRSVYEIGCSVTDGFHNKTEGSVRIHILSAQELDEVSYIRFIDTENLERTNANGGLLINSKWRKDDLYEELQNALLALDQDAGYIMSFNYPLNT